MRKLSLRGVGLGTVLLVAALLSTLAFGLAGLATSHLHLSNRDFNTELAADAARSVVADGMAALIDNEQFGGDAIKTGTTLNFVGPEESAGLLTFDPDEATRLGIPVSTNNLAGTDTVTGFDGSIVPAQAVQLIGVGRFRGVTRTTVTVLHRPSFPYAIASDGPIRFEGGVLVTAVREGTELDPTALTEEDYIPASIGSGSTEGEAVFLGPETTISGDVEASGGIVLDTSDSVSVMGEVLSNKGEISVPKVDFEDYALEDRESQVLNRSIYSSEKLVLEGSVKREGDLTVTNGLELRNTLLYVDGDLTVSGGLSGVGLVIVNQNTRIRGGADLGSANQLAIASMGDIELTGSGKEGSFFNGMVYTEGALRADKITIMGNLIAAGEDERILLEDTRFVEVPGSADVSFELEELSTLEGGPPNLRNYPQDDDKGKFAVRLDDGHMAPNAVVSDTSDGHNLQLVVEQPRDNVAGLRAVYPGTGRSGVTQGPFIVFNSPAELEEQLIPIFEQFPVDGGPSARQRARQAVLTINNHGNLGMFPVSGSSGTAPSSTSSARIITFDPSSFLRFSDAIRVKHWQEF